MTVPRIVVTRPMPVAIDRAFAARGCTDVWVFPEDRPIPRADLLRHVAGAAALVATPADVSINAELFDAAGPGLRIVANYAVGYDNVDIAEARRRGIIVANTPHAVTEPTADIAWLLILGAARRATEGARLVRSGGWTGVAPNLLLGHRLVGGTLLIVGAGRIGLAVARRSVGWNMRVLYVARTRHPEFEAAPIGAAQVPLAEGLAQADVVSIHTPLAPETRHLIGADELAAMKPGAVLVNTARGPVVDEAALVEALRARRIFAAGLDVFEREPALADGLADMDNAFLLPHLGSATVEDRAWMVEMVVENVTAALRGAPVPYRVC